MSTRKQSDGLFYQVDCFFFFISPVLLATLVRYRAIVLFLYSELRYIIILTPLEKGKFLNPPLLLPFLPTFAKATEGLRLLPHLR